jgi:GcrA cell cycle regulator
MQRFDEPWSAPEVLLLTKLWADGKSASQIAAEIKHTTGTRRSRNAVLGKAHRLDLPIRKSPIAPVRRGRSAKDYQRLLTHPNEDWLKWEK